MKTFVVTLLLSLSTGVIAAEANCKLVIRTRLSTGKKKVNVEEIYTASRQDCQSEAQLRRVLTSEESDDVEDVKVTFGWRAPSP